MSMSQPPERWKLLGRASEREALDRLVADVRGGQSRSLVLRGEAGIGKTALLEDLVDSALDLTIVRAAGVESEMELAFASLHQLCWPFIDRLETLPAPQREAVGVAFGLESGPPPDRFLVGLGVLSLLSAVAEERPVLCLIDDAQWLDEASALTLSFVARRVLAEPIGIVFAAREPADELEQLPVLDVRGLRNGDARELLGSVLRSVLDEQVRDRIIAETQGNPLALLELPRGLTETQLAGGFGLPETQAIPARIEQNFVRRLNTLCEEARRLLLVAAAEPLGDPLLVWRAAERLEIGPTAADDVRAQGLLAIEERVVFRHPLVRSAVYGSAAAEDRRAVHLALAHATDPAADPDRRAWHLAAAATGPDERLAMELERVADRAQARGGLAAAAAFLQRAVALTEDRRLRGGRALAAAGTAFQAGAFDVAMRLVAAAEAEALDESQRAHVDRLRGDIAFASGHHADAPPLLFKAAKRFERIDLDLARETYMTAWVSATVAAGTIAGGAILLDISHAILDLPRPRGALRPLDVLLHGLALLTTEGHAGATSTLQRAAGMLTAIPVEDVLRWGYVAPSASNAVWDNDGAYAICARQVELVRDAGALARLPLYLSGLVLARAWSGDLQGAASDMAEAESVAAATGSMIAPWAALRVRALQGREAEATAEVSRAIEEAAAGAGNVAIYAHWAAAVLYNGLSRYEDAAAAAQEATSNTFEYWVSVWVLPELVEAAVRIGDQAGARDALERLTETTQPCANDLALGIEARCRALMSDGEAADSLYREAIDRLSRTRVRPELARARLLYGEWLRRDRRRLDAREQLRIAHDMFTDIGMQAFAERAGRELFATGATVRARTVETRDDLTQQERQIARMAGEGLSNPEIGARLFLSPRTVEYHLRKVFGKLGIQSRHQLADALPVGEPNQ
jgi:DNA-binding CsgD family transcriptional regulator